MDNSSEPSGFAIALRAIEELRAHELEPSVTNFAVWTAHLAGAHPELSQAIEGLIEGPMHVTDAAVHSLYFQYFVPASDEILDLGDHLKHQLEEVTTALAEATDHSTHYGEALDGASSALNTSVQPHVLEALVGNLIQATRNMRERTRELEQRIAQTSGEVTALRENLDKVREESLTDPLTGAANRKRFDEFLETERRRAEMSGRPFALVLCDIDNFKRVNDDWGHNTGDQVIRYIVSVLQTAAEEHHLVARFGGEEFAIVMPNATAERGGELAEHARGVIESKILRRRTTNEELGKVTASFGVAQLQPGEPGVQLIERADSALYAAKRGGRNRVSVDAACGELKRPSDAA